MPSDAAVSDAALDAARIDAAPDMVDAAPVPDAAPADAAPPIDARAPDAFVGPATFEFQDGAKPTADYAGTRDTQLREGAPTTNYGTRTGSVIDGEDDDTGLRVHALLRWDVRAIPAGARVTRVRLALEILDWPGYFAVYDIRPLRRDWDEGAATWQNATSAQAWQSAGALGSADQVSTVVGGLEPRANGAYTIDLDADGIAEVQRWIDDPSSNVGFVIYDSSSDGMEIATREATTVAHRPRLIVDVQ